MSDFAGYAGLGDERRRDLKQDVRRTLPDPAPDARRSRRWGLEKVEVEHLLVMETTKAFGRAAADARAADFSWEQIAQRVPGLVRTYGPQAAETLFEMVAVAGCSLGERYAPWRCGDCDGRVRDYGPNGGHPVDAEPGHRGDCERRVVAVSAYEADLDLEADDQSAVRIMRAVSNHRRNLESQPQPIEIEGPGLGL